MTVIDPFTNFPFAIPIENKEAETVADALLRNIIWLFGIPNRILSDLAKEFVGEIMQHVTKELGIKHIKTSGFQPQSNGVCERFNRTVVSVVTGFQPSKVGGPTDAPFSGLAVRDLPLAQSLWHFVRYK